MQGEVGGADEMEPAPPHCPAPTRVSVSTPVAVGNKRGAPTPADEAPPVKRLKKQLAAVLGHNNALREDLNSVREDPRDVLEHQSSRVRSGIQSGVVTAQQQARCERQLQHTQQQLVAAP